MGRGNRSLGDEGCGGDVSLCHGRGGVAASGRRDGYPKRVARWFQPGWSRLLDDRRRKTVGEWARIGPKAEWVGRAGP
jgi:hypothetical protein